MKFSFFIITIVCSFSITAQTLFKVEKFGENKGNLKMYTYVPNDLDVTRKSPLVFVLHGCTQSANQIANATGWNKLADSLHFIVVYPEQKQINNATKCFNFFVGFKAKKEKGEVASIRQMVDYCFKNYKIDSTQIFITGMSAGGGMSNAMLNAYPQLFNAGAIIAGPSTLFDENKSINEKQPRIAILQGEEDHVVPKGQATKILTHWLNKHQIDKESVIEEKNYLGIPQLTVQQYDDKVILLKANDVGHKLMIDTGEQLSQGGENDFYTVDIDFHSTFWIAQFFGLAED